MDHSALYADLLAARCAEVRMEGIRRWTEFYGLTEELAPLLDDDAPVVRTHGGRRVLVEVRAAALVALQDSHRERRSEWNLGAVRVRRAMPADEAIGRAEASLSELDPQRRREVLSLAAGALRDRVAPARPDEEPACQAYLVLLRLGQVGYREQRVDPRTLLTPLQEEIHNGQLVSPRPRPHVRFDDPQGRAVGYLYRLDGRWVLDMNESPLAGEVTATVGFWRRLSRGGVPRLVLDQDGAAQRHPSGQGLLTEGVVPHDTDEPVEYLRSVAAFVAQRHAAELVVDDGRAARKPSIRPEGDIEDERRGKEPEDAPADDHRKEEPEGAAADDRETAAAILAILEDDRVPARGRVRFLVESLDRAIVRDLHHERYHAIAAQALARAVAATGVLFGHGSIPAVAATVSAAEAYARTPNDATKRTYFACATASYPFGPGEGHYGIGTSHTCEPGSGCVSGAGTLDALGVSLGFEAVIDALPAALVPWLREARPTVEP